MSYKDIILKTIDLQNYSKSKNWIGYFERNVPYSFEFVKKTIDIFLNFFDVNDFIIATSYHIDTNNMDLNLSMENSVKEIEKKLIYKKYISLINYENLRSDNDFFALDTNFKIININDIELYKKFSIMAMCDTHISGGHCFFISTKNDIIIYPHSDESGYGCFYINKKENSIGYDFLKYAITQKEFNANFET